MKLKHISTMTLLSMIVVGLACGTPPKNNNQRNATSNAAQSNASQTSPSQNKAVPQPTTTGSIEVNSAPPGARVLLVSTD
jgi:hypothetical protein